MFKKYIVTIEFRNGRRNQLVKWCESEEKARRLALRDWGNPAIFEWIEAIEA